MSIKNDRVDYSGLIYQTLKNFVSEVKLHPYNFLSESDIQCTLFMMLKSHREIRNLQITNDGREISPLHSEVTYFTDEGKLNFHVDLSLIDPKTTDVYSNRKKLEIFYAKEYRAGICYAAIEIKYNRRDSKNKTLEKWEKDWVKLENILARNPLLTCYSILHDKKNHFSNPDEIIPYSQKYSRIKIIYINANGDAFYLNFLKFC